MIVAAVGSFVTVLQRLLMDNVLDTNEWASLAGSVIILAVTVWRVYETPNVPVETKAPVEEN